MKKISLLLFLLLGLVELQAQAPSLFHYQAVARDASGNVISGNLTVRFALREDDPNGITRYTETHQAYTNTQGVIDLTVGDGSVVSGNMETIDWEHHQYWLQVELKTPEASDFTLMGASQLMSVPYALYASTSGNTLTAGGGISIDQGVISNTGDLSDQNELQRLDINGNQLSLSDGNTVILPTGPTYTAGNGISILNNIVSAADPSATNELQTLSLNGQQLSLSNGGGSVTLPSGTSSWAVNGITTYHTPASDNVAIGGNSSPNARLTVTGNGTDVAGFFSNTNGAAALNATALTTGTGISATSVGGRAGQFVSATGTAGYFSSGLGYALVTDAGNVGLGTLTPARRLHVSGSTLLTDPNNGVALEIGSGKVGIGVTSPTNKFQVNGSSFMENANGPALVTGDGNVGIGIVNPLYKCDIKGTLRIDGIPNSANSTIIAYSHDAPRVIGAIAYGSGDAAEFDSYNGHGLILTHHGTGGNATGLRISTNLGDWDIYGDPAKDINFAHDGTLRAWISDTDGSYHNSSDRRLKKDIQPMQHVLKGIEGLQAYTYHMKNAEEDAPLSLGFMAQDVEQQFPELVVEKDGYKSLCYDHFAVLAIEAVKEQQALIDAQADKIIAQQNQLDDQASALESLRMEIDQLRQLVMQKASSK